MQEKSQEIVICKFCKQSFPLTQMYAHRTECNTQNHPDYQSIILNNEKKFQQIQEEIQIDSQNKLQINSIDLNQKENVQNMNQQKSIQENISQKYKTEITSQGLKQQDIESILVQTTKKCEYCNEIYPKEIIQDHYPNCQIYLMIEQLQIEETQNQFDINQNYVDNQFQQQKFPQNFSTMIHEELQSDGKILQKIITRNPLTNQIYENIVIIDSNDNKQQQEPQQTIMTNVFQQNVQSFINENDVDFNELEKNDRQNVAIQNLVKIKFCDSKELEQEFKECGICFMNYLNGEELVLLPCIHRFHNQCISKWFIDQQTCPICKINVEQQQT